MSSSATKIAVSCRWGEAGDIPFDGQGQNHVTVSSKARIEANIHRGNITIATAPVPATRNRVRRLPLADAPDGEGPSDEGPSDGPPRRRQRTLDSFLVSSPASSTPSEKITDRTRCVLRSPLLNQSGEEMLSSTGWVSEAD